MSKDVRVSVIAVPSDEWMEFYLQPPTGAPIPFARVLITAVSIDSELMNDLTTIFSRHVIRVFQDAGMKVNTITSHRFDSSTNSCSCGKSWVDGNCEESN